MTRVSEIGRAFFRPNWRQRMVWLNGNKLSLADEGDLGNVDVGTFAVRCSIFAMKVQAIIHRKAPTQSRIFMDLLLGWQP